MSIQIFLCSYVNWCSTCSNVTIETAESVMEVNWESCTKTLEYNMTVSNSDSVVLYSNSTTCCSGNLTIHYNVSKLDTCILTFMYYLKVKMHKLYIIRSFLKDNYTMKFNLTVQLPKQLNNRSSMLTF